MKSNIELREDLKVLFVEDSEMVRESTYDILSEFFTHVDIAINGKEGLQQYIDFHKGNNSFYDIVITDINMPKMNGIEMIEHIFVANSKAHIIVMSAHDESKYLLKLINMGISNFILKPIEIVRFNTVIENIIENIINEKRLNHYHNKREEISKNLQKSKETAENSSKQKSQFLANMSHEIRTPLNAIVGFISILNDKETDEEKLKYLNIIKKSSNTLLQIISDILDVSKIESGKLDIEPVDFNPYESLISIGDLFQSKAIEKGVVLKFKYNNSLPQSLYCDVLRIKQILSNLLSNAIKFTPKGSVVKCIISYGKGRLNIRVKDYGIGIALDKQSFVFDAFSQIEGTTKEYGGTGLGLAICKELSHMLGGDLTLQSEEGKGSIFTLSIPIAISKIQEVVEVEEIIEENFEKDNLTGHILIVEDYEANQMFLGIILENAGMTYDIANNGLEAIEMFKKNSYDLILMDENMPKMGGIASTKEIRQIEDERKIRHTPVVSLTANALKGDRERFLRAGMDDYLTKPIEPANLLKIINNFLIMPKEFSSNI
ncbi:MAG: response regulator [Sulfurovum sp.]